MIKKNYCKPSVTRVKLATKEQVLQFCRTMDIDDAGTCYNESGILPEIYGPPFGE